MGIISSSGDSSLSAGCKESDREKVRKNQETIGKRLIMEQNAGKTTAKNIVNSKRDRQIERLKEKGDIRDNTGRHEVGFYIVICFYLQRVSMNTRSLACTPMCVSIHAHARISIHS